MSFEYKQNGSGDWNAKHDKCGKMILKKYMSREMVESTAEDHERNCKGSVPWTHKGSRREYGKGNDVTSANLPPRYFGR